MSGTDDPAALDAWYVVGRPEDIAAAGAPVQTRLLGHPLTLACAPDGGLRAEDGATGRPLPLRTAYGHLWSTLGTPDRDLFGIAEFDEPDRRVATCGAVEVRASGLRLIENFLDMAHFPYVHTGILGEEPHTEVKDYQVDVASDEVLATGCLFFQPMAAANAGGGMDVEYIYRVPHPYCAILYKSSPGAPDRKDVIALFLQPEDEEHVRANMLLSLVDDETSDARLRNFQQTIFAQDKPILENQIPKRLPLDPRAETPIRADKSSISYRRWLQARGVTYGTIPARH